MKSFKDGTVIKTPQFASATGTRTSNRNVHVIAGGAYVESDWTDKSAAILGKRNCLAICTDRTNPPKPWTGSSHVHATAVKVPKGWESV